MKHWYENLPTNMFQSNKHMEDFFNKVSIERVSIMEKELKAFFKTRFGHSNTSTMHTHQDRGNWNTYSMSDKTDFVFDGKIVFSVEMLSEHNRVYCEVVRFY